MDIKLPELGENISEAQVLKVLVSAGDQVEAEQPLAEIETDKASIEVPSPISGTVEELAMSEGDTIRVGQTIASIRESENSIDGDDDSASDGDNSADDGEADDEDEDEGGSPSVPTTGAVPVFAAPSVRTFAREIGVDVREVAGSGPDGRISIEDVKRHARAVRAPRGSRPMSPPSRQVPLPDFSQWGEIEREEMTSVRRKVADHMALAWSTIPHVALFEKADGTALEAARQRFRSDVEEASGAKLTLTAMLLKILAAGLRAHPEIAATADVAKGRII